MLSLSMVSDSGLLVKITIPERAYLPWIKVKKLLLSHIKFDSGRFSPFIVSYLDHGYVKSPFLSKGYLYKEVILLVNFSCR